MYGYKVVTEIVKNEDVAYHVQKMINGDPFANNQPKYELINMMPYTTYFEQGKTQISEVMLVFKSIEKVFIY
ncbi:MAG: hypothetical protein MJ245_02730 [Clostridia bacterium]|nr:hypothetical protein [Clostridia bacterium]